MSLTRLLNEFCVSITIVSFLILGRASAWADDILVSAAASLTDVLKEIAIAYRSQTQSTAHYAFGSSSALARQIEAGAPADIFFSADLETMDKLEKNGRLEPGTRKHLLSNQLVIIVPADSPITIGSARDLVNPQVKRIALAEPSSVPVGVYSRKYLEAEGLWNKVKAKVVPVLDVRAALSSVESGNVEAGFVYKTDAANSSKVTSVFEVPIEKGPKIIYPVAILRESRKKAAARNFLNLLISPFGQSVLKKHEFLVLQ
jgi:molybdate transport system substrate-binding protein